MIEVGSLITWDGKNINIAGLCWELAPDDCFLFLCNKCLRKRTHYRHIRPSDLYSLTYRCLALLIVLLSRSSPKFVTNFCCMYNFNIIVWSAE